MQMEKRLKLDDIKTGLIFDKKQTNIAKGIALLMLLLHHLFYNNPEKYDSFISLFSIKGIPVECFIADFCKVCVAIFLFLSGYGLYKSYNSYIVNLENRNYKVSIKNDFIYVKNHLINLLSQYWFIYIIFVSMGFFFGRNPFDIYQGNILYFVTDFFGLAYLFGTPSMNLTWWFMSIIILFYLAFPLLFRIHKYSPEILLITSTVMLFYPNILFSPRLIYLWLCPFVFGMYISDNNILERLANKGNKKYKIAIFSIISLFLLLLLRYSIFNNYVSIDFLIALFIVLTSYVVISKIPILNRVLEELGKYSGQIFMFHTFIYHYYFKEQIYWFKYSILIYLVMVIVCYVVARLISWLMQVTRYNKLIKKITTIRG